MQDVKMVAWHPDGDVLASASYDDTVKLWIESDDEWICAQTLVGAISAPEILPDGLGMPFPTAKLRAMHRVLACLKQGISTCPYHDQHWHAQGAADCLLPQTGTATGGCSNVVLSQMSMVPMRLQRTTSRFMCAMCPPLLLYEFLDLQTGVSTYPSYQAIIMELGLSTCPGDGSHSFIYISVYECA